MDNLLEFVDDMRKLDGDIIDYTDAFTFAMETCGPALDGPHGEAVVFGAVGPGTFFSGSDLDRCRWFPDSRTHEVIGIIEAEFGEEMADAVRR